MNSLVGVLAPFGVLFVFLYRAFVPSEVNISTLLEEHALDLGVCCVCVAWMSVNLLKGSPKPSLPEPEPAKPEPAPDTQPDPVDPPETPEGTDPQPAPAEPEQVPEPVKQVRKFQV